ncbi:hypothetical protein Tco_1073243, partial [Tanacetum coccineum]
MTSSLLSQIFRLATTIILQLGSLISVLWSQLRALSGITPELKGLVQAEVFPVVTMITAVVKGGWRGQALERKDKHGLLGKGAGKEGNVAGKKKVKESMKANLGKLLKYNAWSTRWSPIR